MTGLPNGITLPELRTALDLPQQTLDDTELMRIVDACVDVQKAYIRPDFQTYYPPALVQALIRRVGRQVTARGIPLGAQSTEYGTTYIPSNDPILHALEAPYCMPVVS